MYVILLHSSYYNFITIFIGLYLLFHVGWLQIRDVSNSSELKKIGVLFFSCDKQFQVFCPE